MKLMNKRRILLLWFASMLVTNVCHATGRCYARLNGDTLRIGNDVMERCFLWNDGCLSTVSMTDWRNGIRYECQATNADFVFAKGTTWRQDDSLCVDTVPQNGIHKAFLRVTVTAHVANVWIKRVYRIYESCPAIGCDTWLRLDTIGMSDAANMTSLTANDRDDVADRKNIEFAEDMKTNVKTPVMERLNLGGNHWRTRVVEFWDVTDWNNNLVSEHDFISYRNSNHRGNLLFAINGEDGSGFFMLKEAPCSSVQLEYNGMDFITDFGHFMMTGPGVTQKDLPSEVWTRAYGSVVGLYADNELNALTSLRTYQKCLRMHIAGRDDMIMVNTWGDRSQDSRVNERFAMQELESMAQLGATHFQIDDGWQSGKSPNSALVRGSFNNIWDKSDYWMPDSMKFPNGLDAVVAKGRELGIQVGLWFNPSIQDDFADWEKDANAIVGLYKKYGISFFKIDGLTITSKKGEERLRRLFDSVQQKTGNNVLFNLDVTASRREGYHTFNEYGNIFLENRYTDWGNYYPYMTLRNLWCLSKYVPAERLQIEFLNKWRNGIKYNGDRFAPCKYSFDYLFAITMAGQPLAWMETSSLPTEAFSIKSTIDAYKKVAAEFHQGVILPIGEEPSGTSWTGFQSIQDDKNGFLLVFREDTKQQMANIQTWFPENCNVRLSPVVGCGKKISMKVGANGRLCLSLPTPNSYALFRYSIK